MSDYRYQITEHNTIQRLHVIVEHQEGDALDGLSHTYIPVDDLWASLIAPNASATWQGGDDTFTFTLSESFLAGYLRYLQQIQAQNPGKNWVCRFCSVRRP